MRHFDFTPLMRTTIGFDRMNRLLETAMSLEDPSPSYPPYNIEKLGDDRYRITLAVAGFTRDDLDITQKDNLLIVSGRVKKADSDEDCCSPAQSCGSGNQYLHKGIAMRAFERRFQMVDYIKILGAQLENGLLHVELQREVPEEKKPRTIAIHTSPAIDQK